MKHYIYFPDGVLQILVDGRTVYWGHPVKGEHLHGRPQSGDRVETVRLPDVEETPARTAALHQLTGLGVPGPGGLYKPDAQPVPAGETCERCGQPGMWIAGAGEVLCVRHQDDY